MGKPRPPYQSRQETSAEEPHAGPPAGGYRVEGAFIVVLGFPQFSTETRQQPVTPVSLPGAVALCPPQQRAPRFCMLPAAPMSFLYLRSGSHLMQRAVSSQNLPPVEPSGQHRPESKRSVQPDSQTPCREGESPVILSFPLHGGGEESPNLENKIGTITCCFPIQISSSMIMFSQIDQLERADSGNWLLVQYRHLFG